MKAAFAIWEHRIAPLFDAARFLHIVEIDSGCIASEHCERMDRQTPVEKIMRLAELGVDVLICGAISKPVHAILSAQGIGAISFVSGELVDIIDACVTGKLGDNCFAMPGHHSSFRDRKTNAPNTR